MALALLLAGVLLVVAAVRDQQSTLFALVKGDLTGDNNFVQWAAALLLVGAIGYVPRLRPVSIALLTLVLLAIFLRRGTGFFSQLQTAVGAKS